MATSSVLKKLGDKASDYAKSLPTILPGDSEKSGLEAKQQMINEATTKPAEQKSEPAPAEKLNPEAKYGDRPGEKRLDYALKPISTSIPSYDDGGDVPEDQVALVHKDEKVLNPREAEQYRAEHEGAPADFGGRVLPNPKGLKPIMDTEAQPRVDEPKDATLSTDNAPLTAPPGDVSNASPEEQGGAHLSESSNKPLRSFEEVRAEQEKPNQPKMAPISDGGEPAEKPQAPKGTPAERSAIDADKKSAMGQGVNGFVKLGTALIHENALSPEASTEDSKQTQVEPSAPQAGPGLKPIMEQHQDTAGGPLQPGAAEPAMDYKQTLANYDKQIQAALNEATPDGQEKADRLSLAKQAYQYHNPYGSEANHPGVLGKLGHIAGAVGNAVGNVLAPKVMQAIPGTEQNRAEKAASTLGRINTESATTTARDAEENKPANASTWKPLDHPVFNPATGKNEVQYYNEKDPSQVKFGGEFINKPGEGHEDDKQKYVEQWFKDHPKEPRNTESIAKAEKEYTEANQPPVLMSEPNGDGSSTVIAAKPGTVISANAAKPGVSQEQQFQLDKMFKGKTLVFTDPNTGKRKGMTYEEAKQEGLDMNGAEVYPTAAAEKLREKSSSYSAATKAFDKYETDLDTSKLTGNDVRSLQVLTSHQDALANDYISKATSGVLDTLFGEPLTGFSQKAMGGIMTKDQYDSLSPAGRAVLSDYFTAMLAHFASMKAQQGSIPRNPAMIQTEMNAIPLPFLNKDEAAPAFSNYRERLQTLNRDNVDFGGKQSEKTKENQPNAEHQKLLQSITLPDGTHPKDAAKGQNGDTIIWSGKQGDPWVDLATGKAVK